MPQSDACKEALDALYEMARLRKVELDVGTDDDGDWFVFILPANDPENIGAHIVAELLEEHMVTDVRLGTGADFRIKVYLTDCTLKKEVDDNASKEV